MGGGGEGERGGRVSERKGEVEREEKTREREAGRTGRSTEGALQELGQVSQVRCRRRIVPDGPQAR